MIGLGVASPEVAVRSRGVAAAFDFTGGVLPAGATLTRATPGSRTNAAGLIASVPADGARFSYDPATLAARGLLIEGARTNLWLRSEAFEDAAWIKGGLSIVADAGVSPDGTSAADRLIPDATNAAHTVAQPVGASSIGTSFAVSVFAKAAGCNFIQLWAQVGFGTFFWNVNVATGVEAGFGAGSSNVGARSITALPNGWFRLSIVLTSIGATNSSNGYVYVYPAPVAPGSRAAATLGDGTGGVLLWGAQAEVGGDASSYVPTAGATATRAADAALLDWGSRGVADGAATIRYGFDDGSSQDVATTIAGGTAAVPTNLNRRWVKRAEKL